MTDQFHTKVVIPPSPVKISYNTRCLFMGSCFSDYIGKIMAGYKFPLLLNPFGTLFNPASVAGNLVNLVSRKVYIPGDLVFQDGLWLSLDHYTGFSHPDRETCLSGINRSVAEASDWLKECEYLVLTFGTAWTYRYNATEKLVANCHKIPQNAFTRVFMKPEEILIQYNNLIPALKKYNPRLKLIFTLSPVRHWADGATGNQLSKSVLYYSIHEILDKHKDAWYFPSYEIFMDELRDYRFYAADMLHPSEQSARYVWERFRDTWVDESSQKIISEIESLLKAFSHRPVNPQSQTYQKFVQATLQKAQQLSEKYPFLDFNSEVVALRGLIP